MPFGFFGRISRRLRLLLALIALVFLASSATLFHLSNSPDRDLQFVREVSTDVSPQVLTRAFTAINNWRDWHFNLKDAELLDATALAPGARIRFFIEPPKKQWKRFEMITRVSTFIPDRELELEFLADSTGRLSRLFSKLSWKIELIAESSPGSVQKTLIRGTLRATTASGRSRIFSKLTPRILMNQVFYPDLEKLSLLEFPKDPTQVTPAQQTPGKHHAQR